MKPRVRSRAAVASVASALLSEISTRRDGHHAGAGAVFDGGDFGDAAFSGGRVDFRVAEISGGRVDFGYSRFSGAEVMFGSSRFKWHGDQFSGGEVNFASLKKWTTPPIGLPSEAPGLTFPSGEQSRIHWRRRINKCAGQTPATPSVRPGGRDTPTLGTSGHPSARTIDPSTTASRGSGSPAAGGYRPCASTGQAGRRSRGTGRRPRAWGSQGARVDRCRSRTYVAPQIRRSGAGPTCSSTFESRVQDPGHGSGPSGILTRNEEH